jgi:predicted nuclease of predicted toxin-antitoxin system
MKFLADVNVSRRVVEQLNAWGFDVTRVTSVLDARSSDRAILAETARRNAILISHDQDFGALLAVSGASSPSFVNLRLSEVDVSRLAASIARALRATHEDLTLGAIVTVDDGGVRVHRLPIT